MNRDVSSYIALALQTVCIAINGAQTAADAKEMRLSSCRRIAAQIAASKRFIGPDVRLVVLPEYVLTGFPMGEDTPTWTEKAAIETDGPEYEEFGKAARAADVFLAGNAYERDANFPGLYFQTSFVIAPSGETVLRYRRIISLFAPSPYDLLDRYVAIYGPDSLFPVADTALGRIGAIASEEILYPEIARILALRGAEIFVHSSSEVASPLPTPKNVAKQARAIENLAYVVSANTAGIAGIPIPYASADAASKIVDHRGMVLAEAGHGESMAAYAEVDIAALRRYRRRPGMANLLSRLPLQLWRDACEGARSQAPNTLLNDNGSVRQPSPAYYADRQRQVIADLIAQGMIR